MVRFGFENYFNLPGRFNYEQLFCFFLFFQYYYIIEKNGREIEVSLNAHSTIFSFSIHRLIPHRMYLLIVMRLDRVSRVNVTCMLQRVRILGLLRKKKSF